MARKKAEEKLNLDEILFKCRDKSMRMLETNNDKTRSSYSLFSSSNFDTMFSQIVRRVRILEMHFRQMD